MKQARKTIKETH